ncbi:MAG TPA: sigma-70 family RNA polymerase sigma factor [Acidobacteriaceae bacterium]|nr:sigma-70 family RNA polymerase sigma factor [Acidobacteriaceae bacterium]
MAWTEPNSSSVAPAPCIFASIGITTAGQRQRDIFDSHRHHVYSVAYYMTGNELEAEEILQDAFIRALQSPAENMGRKKNSEIDGIDRALLAVLMERFSLTPTLEAELPNDEIAAVALDPARNVRRTDLEEAVWGLPDAERLLFLLRDVEGYSPERIARLVCWPVAQVCRTLHSARMNLRQQLAVQAAAKA